MIGDFYLATRIATSILSLPERTRQAVYFEKRRVSDLFEARGLYVPKEPIL